MTAGSTRRIGDVPVLEMEPNAPATGGLVIWIPPLGGDKERYRGLLEGFAQQGLLAVGIDPRRHGERADLPADRLSEQVMQRFRATMWPILGGTVLDAMAVIDDEIGCRGIDGPVLAGGVSMGGDIAVALAGIDPRVSRVAAIAATPDWTRPGMTRIGAPDRPIDQGRAPGGAAWLRGQLDPIGHPGRYRRGQAIRFDVGTADTHVPAEAAHRFASLVGGGAGVVVADHPGLDHLDVCRDTPILEAAAAWLSAGADAAAR